MNQPRTGGRYSVGRRNADEGNNVIPAWRLGRRVCSRPGMATGSNQTWICRVGKQSIQMEGIKMTREKTKEAIRVMQAYVDGKEVESVNRRGIVWMRAPEPCWDWLNCDYQIKPTPVLRPWTADEVPLGAQVRSKSYHPDHRSLITTSGNPMHREGLLNGYEHSLDGGKTWKPCGVEEESK